MKKLNTLMAAAFALAFVAGCTPQAQDQYDKAGDAASNAATHTGNAIATDANAAGEAVKDSAENAAEATANSEMTGKVKAAILAANDLEARNINVDTIDKTIHLKGTVESQKDKDRAEALAKGVAGNDYTVSNELTVDTTMANNNS